MGLGAGFDAESKTVCLVFRRGIVVFEKGEVMIGTNSTHEYTAETSDEGIEYLLILDEPEDAASLVRAYQNYPLYSYEVALSEDFDTLVQFIASTGNSDSLRYYWDNILPANFFDPLDPVTQTVPLLRAYVSNPSTPRVILEEILLGLSPYGTSLLNMEPEILDQAMTHPNSDDELKEKFLKYRK